MTIEEIIKKYKAEQHIKDSYTLSDDEQYLVGEIFKLHLASEANDIHRVVGQGEQLAEEKLCGMNQNFVCNCIDDRRCPNFRG